MGVRYSILGFNQEEVLKIEKKVTIRNKEVLLKLDVNDLLILKQIADFPNRKNTIKVITDDKMFFWVSYKEIIAELPILDIKKQALADRLTKLVELGLLERSIQSYGGNGNMTFFRMGDKYENLLYQNETSSSQTQEGMVSDYDRGYSSEIQDINNNSNNNISKDNSSSSSRATTTTKRFTPPTIEELKQYIYDEALNVNAEYFFDYYTANGWMAGNRKMRDWKATARNWSRRENGVVGREKSCAKRENDPDAYIHQLQDNIRASWAKKMEGDDEPF